MRTDRFLLVAIFLAAVGCKSPPPTKCNPLADKSVIACVDDEPISKVEVATRIRTAEWVPGSAKKPDAARVALDEAIRAQLLAKEAKRRKLKLPIDAPPANASWMLALRDDESRVRNISRASVSDAEARKYYDEHPEAFGQIDEATLQAIIVRDPSAGERAYTEAQGADEAKFAELAKRLSEDVESREKGGSIGEIRASRGADRELLRLALTLRRKGAIGGPVQAADGRWYVVRIASAPVEKIPPWAEQSREKARNILIHERQEAALKELADRFVKAADVRVFDDALAALSPTRTKDR